jgi:hypothetical protein
VALVRSADHLPGPVGATRNSAVTGTRGPGPTMRLRADTAYIGGTVKGTDDWIQRSATPTVPAGAARARVWLWTVAAEDTVGSTTSRPE